jgi:GGDEF domain-containing protein
MAVPPPSDPVPFRSAYVVPSRAALRDPLTGGVIPSLWLDRLDQALVRGARLHTGVAVVALACLPTLDEYQAADAAIVKELARLWLLRLRAGDSLSHFGQGGFLGLLDEIDAIVAATHVAERLVAAVPATLQAPG